MIPHSIHSGTQFAQMNLRNDNFIIKFSCLKILQAFKLGFLFVFVLGHLFAYGTYLLEELMCFSLLYSFSFQYKTNMDMKSQTGIVEVSF